MKSVIYKGCEFQCRGVTVKGKPRMYCRRLAESREVSLDEYDLKVTFVGRTGQMRVIDKHERRGPPYIPKAQWKGKRIFAPDDSCKAVSSIIQAGGIPISWRTGKILTIEGVCE